MLKSPRYHNWNFPEWNNNSLRESSELRAAAETRLELDLKTSLTTRQLGGLVDKVGFNQFQFKGFNRFQFDDLVVAEPTWEVPPAQGQDEREMFCWRRPRLWRCPGRDHPWRRCSSQSAGRGCRLRWASPSAGTFSGPGRSCWGARSDWRNAGPAMDLVNGLGLIFYIFSPSGRWCSRQCWARGGRARFDRRRSAGSLAGTQPPGRSALGGKQVALGFSNIWF